MELKLSVLLLVVIFFHRIVIAQQDTYTVTLAPFSSDKYNEFSPVYYKDGIIFCTTRKLNPFVNYSSSRDGNMVKIFYIDTTKTVTWKKADLFSKNLTTHLNDGPVTFSKKWDTIYFSRNLRVEGTDKKLSASRNKLGIFSAVLVDQKWIKIREMRFNNEWYNISTPWLSADGTRLYFSSDKPDGYGGSDLYYSDLRDGFWSDPINLGPVINTSGNESYPFVNQAGELLFSSDGHPGLGGKDIFFSCQKGNDWLPPVRLDSPVNSQFDDFGITTDSLMSEGYFSSKRGKTIDIFMFKTKFPQIFYADIQKENQYCFRFSDSGDITVDTMNLKYIWDFGDGKKEVGAEVNHCFPGPGKYKVKLDIVDKLTGKLFFSKLSYTVSLKDFEQPYINSPDVIIAGVPCVFDGFESKYPGYKIISYSWKFGNEGRMQGESVKFTFKRNGNYNVTLGLKIQSLSTGVIHNTGVMKKILVLNNDKEKATYLTKKASLKTTLPDIRKCDNANIVMDNSAEEDFKKGALFRINLLSSKNKIGVNSSIFRKIPNKYNLKEIFEPVSATYNYIAEEQMSLMALYPAYRELFDLGFKDEQIILSIIKDPAGKELLSLKNNYGVLMDNYFDNHNKFTSNAYIMLDQIVKLMNKYPSMKLEVAVHTDNIGPEENNLKLSQERSQILVNYLIERGVNARRLFAIGFGGSRPVAQNFLEKGRKLNRRIDFIIVNQ